MKANKLKKGDIATATNWFTNNGYYNGSITVHSTPADNVFKLFIFITDDGNLFRLNNKYASKLEVALCPSKPYIYSY